ncbi:putative regulator of septum formation [Asanoa ferruginea]|uniref:Putative regulator of septum formation n=2 Tax=Asanoa ferruginea TaxID=53367 RepID=A0A3D9ZFQ4_9ACTN|nr:putative regulator of septum formation [Asanoa ferruginea]
MIGSVVTSVVIVAVGCFGVVNHIDQKSLHRDDYRFAADSLFVGQCIKEIPDLEVITKVTAIACESPHNAEVVGNVRLDRTRPFPTQKELLDIQGTQCAEELQKWAPAFVDDETVNLGVLYPEQPAWNSGARTVTCFAAFTDGPRTGTLHR